MRLGPTHLAIVIVALLGVGFGFGRGCAPDAPTPTGGGSDEDERGGQTTIWTCSMHPSVRLPEPGECPICFMPLIPADVGDDADAGPRVLKMTPAAVAMAEIETARVEQRSVAHEVNMVGKVAFDETRLAYITSWVAGRLDRLFVDYTGLTVRQGDHLTEIYSPTLYAAQKELLTSVQATKRVGASTLESVKRTGDATVLAATEKLQLYGMSDAQIAEILERGTPSRHVTMEAPFGGVVVNKNAVEGMSVKEGDRIYTIADLSKVWVVLHAYESDLAWLRYGQEVEFRVEAYPSEVFYGRIAFIDPTLDDRTRTVNVRLNVDNSDGRLKPDMFVSATGYAMLTEGGRVIDENLAGKWMCPMHPEVVADGAEECSECGMDLVPATELGFEADPGVAESIVIPATAPLITGVRAVVYVKVPDAERPTFEGRVIVLGPRAGEWYIVEEGLEVGEEVVVKGNFKIDSELQIRARPSMMSPEESAREFIDAPFGFRREVGHVLDAYLGLQRALAADEDDGVLAQSIVDGVVALGEFELPSQASVAWKSVSKPLHLAANELAKAPTIAARRDRLASMTDALVEVVRTFGYERAQGEVGLFHCPMALGGFGADWIQAEPEVANPYYGSEMLRCGSLTEMLPAGD